MKGSKSLIAITIAISLAITPSAIAAQKTTLKAAGRDATTVVNTILSGAVIPTKAIGIDGDFYIDTKNANLYGPKTKGVWKIATSLKQTDTKSVTTVIGEQGGMGATGPQGEKGDKGATGSTGAAGSNGFSGATGATGAKGNDGATGVSGVAGSIGATGSVGATGATGAKGDTGLTGATGAAGAAGAKGDAGTNGTAGAKGDTGTKGDTGASGVDGISKSIMNSLTTIQISTASAGGNGNADFFTVTEPGNYTFQLFISATTSKTDDLDFTAEIISGGSPIANQTSVSTAAVIGTIQAPGRRFGIIASGVVANAALGTSYGFRITLVSPGASTYTVYLTGRALINKVGSIG